MGVSDNNRNSRINEDEDYRVADRPEEDEAHSSFVPLNFGSLREKAARREPQFLKQVLRKHDDAVPRRPGFVRRKVSEWADRVLGAAKQGGLSDADAEYEAGQTQQDYLWNSVGQTIWGTVFPILTVVITQLLGVEQAGRFAFAFMVGQLLMFLGNYGVRTYQVSDREEKHAFVDYQVNRWLTCIIMLVAGWLFCRVMGYEGEMATMTLWVIGYKMVDALADVYEGRLQQVDKLYLAGISQALRSAAAIIVFSLALLFTRNAAIASIAMAVAAGLTCLFFTMPLALLETPRSSHLALRSIGSLFVACAPLFAALFLYQVIDNMPRFMMERMMPYDNQLYFNALLFPAYAILITVGMLYKPLLVRMADAWNDLSRRRRFDMFLAASVLAIVIITVVGVVLMATIGIPITSFLYGVDFEPYRKVAYIMIVAGGITAGIDFLYQVMTIMRRQAVVMKLYIITLMFALFVPYALIRTSGLQGAALSYAIVMAVLAVLLLMEYISVRMNYRRHPEDDPLYRATAEKMGQPIPERAMSARELVDPGMQRARNRANPTQRRPKRSSKDERSDEQ